VHLPRFNSHYHKKKNAWDLWQEISWSHEMDILGNVKEIALGERQRSSRLAFVSDLEGDRWSKGKV
jgi:hypothetical protein